MKSLFSPEASKALDRFLASDPILVFDYDGTLAPLIGLPEKAFMLPSTLRLLKQVTRRYSCSVVTGRGLSDLRKVCRGPRFKYWVGNHGMEWSCPGMHIRRDFATVNSWRKLLHRELGRIPGLEIEYKKYSISIHYRQCPNHAEAIRAIRKAIAKIRGKRVIGGKEIFNLLPLWAENKGTAVKRIARLEGARSVLFAGDDKTDEDVFRMKRGGIRIFPIHVGAENKSRARYLIPKQPEIDRLLKILIAKREPVSARSRTKRNQRRVRI